jgi:hypothetical protein
MTAQFQRDVNITEVLYKIMQAAAANGFAASKLSLYKESLAGSAGQAALRTRFH